MFHIQGGESMMLCGIEKVKPRRKLDLKGMKRLEKWQKNSFRLPRSPHRSLPLYSNARCRRPKPFHLSSFFSREINEAQHCSARFSVETTTIKQSTVSRMDFLLLFSTFT